MIIDVSGFSFTGKGAVLDYLRGIDNIHVHEKEFEFDLIRIQDGILDLKYALKDNWSPIRSDSAIRRFIRLTNTFARQRTSLMRPTSLFLPTGQIYEERFNKNFIRLTADYIESLIDSEIYLDWPFSNFNDGPIKAFYKKIKGKLGVKTLNKYYLSFPENFESITSVYLNSVLFSSIADDKIHVATSNAFEPFNTELSLNLFSDAKSIIVERDPRDSFISYVNYNKIKNKDLARCCSDFIIKYKILRRANQSYVKNQNDVLNIQFEDMVNKYAETTNKIHEFLGIDKTHINKKYIYFDPGKSKKNIHAWKKFHKEDIVERISLELKKYCID
jgi:hypothetical protein